MSEDSMKIVKETALTTMSMLWKIIAIATLACTAIVVIFGLRLA
jgi:hypothetical protein